MPIYCTAKKETFLNETAKFICSNFNSRLDKVKVILPNGYLCADLQKIIIEKLGTTILPTAIPISGISSEGLETFKIPTDQIGRISALEERIILTETIHSYKKLNYTKTKSLDLSSSLAKLFFEFEANNVELTTLKNIPTLNQAEHWHFIYDFLEFAFKNWRRKIYKLKKLTPGGYQKLMLNAELNRIKNDEGFLVIAGVIGNNKSIHDFIIKTSKYSNGHVIMPPLPAKGVRYNKLLIEDPIYNIAKIINKRQNIPYLDKKANSLLDELIINEKFTENNDYENINYVEFEHVIQEAKYVAKETFDQIQKNSNAKIAIVITDDELKNYFTSQLTKLDLKFTDLIGENISNHHLATLLIEIAENICKKLSLKNFTNLILHPSLISKETMELKTKLARESRFEDTKFQLQEPFQFELSSSEKKSFPKLLNKIIKISQKLAPGLWESLEGQKIKEMLDEVTEINWQIDDLETLPEILKNLIFGGSIVEDNLRNDNILICSSNDVSLMNFDLLIYTNFAERAYPKSQINNPWLNNQMIVELGLDSWAARFGNSMYEFYLNLHNKKILITRSLKNDGARKTLPSPFLYRLKNILGDKWTNITYSQPYSFLPKINAVPLYASSKYFPAQISATDIEILIRAPYNFFAKKILGLKPEHEIQENPALSEFGNMFHKVAELYTKNFGTQTAKTFEDYGKEFLNNSIFPAHTKKFWLLKIQALASASISFDQGRRDNAREIFCEIKGSLELDIKGTKIQINAIADRIELDKQDTYSIIDYKTGVIPSKKDVLSALSPQLIVEAIILLEGGFTGIATNIIENINLTYVKISSHEPFISQTNITVSYEDILAHKQGLINLLTHYITSGKYPIEISLMKYDDYKHLARRKKHFNLL